MLRPKKIKSPEDFGKEFEGLKKTIPAEKKYSPEAIGGGITIFGDKETTEKVVEELKKYDNQMGKTDLSDLPETEFEKATKEAIKEGTPLEELQELEKKLRACTDETPRDIRYATFSGEEFDLHIEYNNITIIASMKDECSKFFAGRKCFNIECKKPYLATAQKILEVLKEWRLEQ